MFKRDGDKLTKKLKDNEDIVFYIREELENGYLVTLSDEWLDWGETVLYLDKRACIDKE